MLAAEEALLGQAATGAGTDFTGRFPGGGGLDWTPRCALRGPLKVNLINFAVEHSCEPVHADSPRPTVTGLTSQRKLCGFELRPSHAQAAWTKHENV